MATDFWNTDPKAPVLAHSALVQKSLRAAPQCDEEKRASAVQRKESDDESVAGSVVSDDAHKHGKSAEGVSFAKHVLMAADPAYMHTLRMKANRRLMKTSQETIQGRCLEDLTTETVVPSRDAVLWEFTKRIKPKVSPPWHTQFASNKPVVVDAPLSNINYDRRLRSKILTFTVSTSAEAAMNTSFLSVTMGDKLLQNSLLECHDAGCQHQIVPLRISLVSYHTSGTPKVALSFQLASDELPLDEVEESKRAPKMWLPMKSTETVAASVSSASATPYASRLEWDTFYQSPEPLTEHSLVHPKSILFQEFPDFINPEYCDAMHAVCGGLPTLLSSAVPVVKPKSESEADLMYLEQPSYTTNASPNLLSYYYAYEISSNPSGTSRMKLEACSHSPWNVNDPHHFFKVTRGKITRTALHIIKEFRRKRYILNTEGGLSGVFVPMDSDLWKSELKKMVDAASAEHAALLPPVVASISIRMDYMVTGSKQLTEVPTPKFHLGPVTTTASAASAAAPSPSAAAAHKSASNSTTARMNK